jgi:collagenase-like PrtC family protease
LEYLKKIKYSGKINISTIMAVYNKEAIRFFIENYKINKFILSREVTLKEIEDLAKEFPKMKFEVFGEGDFCRYNNGLCFAEHKY